MASAFLLRPLRPSIAIGLTFTSAFAASQLVRPYSRPLLLDTSPSPVSPKDWSFSQYNRDARTPVVDEGWQLNAGAVRQISTGSILGLLGGLAVSTFSKTLTLLIGALVFGIQALESRGLHIIPYQRMQRYAQGINIRSAVQDNVAFKLSFGATFALAAFAEF